MERLQELGFAALRDKQLPLKAKPFAQVLTRADQGLRLEVKRDTVRALLSRTADWKSVTGKRVKSELRQILGELV